MIRFFLGAAMGAFGAAYLIAIFLSSSREDVAFEGSVDDLIETITSTSGTDSGTHTWHI